MAWNVIEGSTSNSDIQARLWWESVADEDTNTSALTVKLEYRTSGGEVRGNGNFTIEIDGETYRGDDFVVVGDEWVNVHGFTITVPHGQNGKKTVSLRGLGSIDGAFDTTYCSGTAKLDDIAAALGQAATIFSAEGVTLGHNCRISWIPRSVNHYYQLEFRFGGFKGNTGFDGIHPNTTSLYTYTGYTVPYDAASEIPYSPSAVMTVTLRTFADTDLSEQVGAPSSVTVAVSVPDDEKTKPEVSLELKPVGFAAEGGIYVQGKSAVNASITANGKYGAKVSSTNMVVDDTVYKTWLSSSSEVVDGIEYKTETYQSAFLTQSEEVLVSGVARDARGFVGEATEKIYVIPYSTPRIMPVGSDTEVICKRCDEDGEYDESGKYIKIRARREYERVEYGETKYNSCELRCRYRKESEEFKDDWITLLDTEAVVDAFDGVVSGAELETDTSYVVQIGVIDTAGESASVSVYVPSDFVIVDIPTSKEGKRIGLFRYAKEEGETGIDVGAPIHGGAVDNLTLETELTASAEAKISLNDIKTPGCYYSPSGDNTANISNIPSGVSGGFGLEVREMQSKDDIRQTLYYGSATWYRHNDGDEWCPWVTPLTGVTTDAAVDVVVECGKHNNLRYRKWSGGAAEVFGVVNIDGYKDSNTLFTSVDLPFAFTEAPAVTMTVEGGYGSLNGSVILTYAYIEGGDTVGLLMIREEGVSVGDSVTCSVRIDGYYK